MHHVAVAAVMSVDFWRVSGAELARPTPGGVPAAALWVIRGFNLVFNGLNALWFSKMLRGAIKARSASLDLLLLLFACSARSLL